jgi:Helix-turn-helix domain
MQMRGLGVALAHINQCQLAKRWNVSPRTLERWRWLGQGPTFLKLGGRVVYRLEDIESIEANHLQANTNGPLSRATMQTGSDR